MTRKDFELIADVLRDVRESYADNNVSTQHVDTVAKCFAIRLQGTNPRFDQDRFMRACGVED
jgi:hypothetical protein